MFVMCKQRTTCYFFALVVAWLFLPETLKTKKHNPSMVTNDDDITSSAMETSNDLINDLEENGEKQPLLRLPRYKKMLVGCNIHTYA